MNDNPPQHHSTASQSATPQRRMISWRVVLAFGIIMLVLLVTLTFVGAHTLSIISDETAEHMARHHSVEAASQFRSYINPHLVLLQQVAQSAAVERWFNDEGNGYLRAEALNEISIFSSLWPHSSLRMVVRSNMREYFFDGQNPPNELVSASQIDSADPDDAWYFYALRSIAPYSMRTANCPHSGEDIRLLISTRVYYQGSNVGVVSVTVSFYDLFDLLFRGTDNGNMNAYIIDRTGIVKIDSCTRGFPLVDNINIIWIAYMLIPPFF